MKKPGNQSSQEIPTTAGVDIRLHVPDLDRFPNPSPCPVWLCRKHTDVGESGLPQRQWLIGMEDPVMLTQRLPSDLVACIIVYFSLE